jgi:ribosomal protein L14
MYIGNNTFITVLDNSGVKKLKNIMVYGRHRGTPADLGIASLAVVRPRRKLKRGNLVRFMLIQSRKLRARPMGSYIRSVAFRAILMKRQEFEPIANRVNGFFFLELRRFEEFRNSSLTVYVI